MPRSQRGLPEMMRLFGFQNYTGGGEKRQKASLSPFRSENALFCSISRTTTAYTVEGQKECCRKRVVKKGELVCAEATVESRVKQSLECATSKTGPPSLPLFFYSPIALYSKAPNPEKRADGRSKAMSESSVNSSTSSGVAPPPVPLLLWLQCFFFAISLLAGGRRRKEKIVGFYPPLPLLPTSVTVGSWGLLDNGGEGKGDCCRNYDQGKGEGRQLPLPPLLAMWTAATAVRFARVQREGGRKNGHY